MDVRVVAALVLAACSSKAKAVEDARTAKKIDAAPPVQVPTGPYRVDTASPKGDVAIRAEWHDVPVASRASPGRTACGTARRPAVEPTTTWGIPDTVVVIAIDHGKALVDPGARVALAGCALSPRVIVSGTTLAIASAAEAPAKLALSRAGELAHLDALAPGKPRDVMLPIAGHEVDATLTAGDVYTLTTDDDAAWIVAATQPYIAITDATGVATLRDVPVGTYAVTAWLPARAGDKARLARGQVTVAAGGLVEVTLDLGKP